MGTVQFDEESNSPNSFTSRKIFGEPVVPTMSRLFIKWGIIKSPTQAKWVMIIIIIGCLATSVFVLAKTYGIGSSKPTSSNANATVMPPAPAPKG